MSGKRIFILWSGGADSTYAIQRCIESDEYDMVFAGYVLIENNSVKIQSELQAIDRMLPLLLPSQKLGWLGVVAKVWLKRVNANLLYKQQALWVYALAAAVDLEVDELAFGLSASDDEGPHHTLPIDDFHRLWDAYRPLLKRQPACVFPVRDLSAAEIRARLRPELRALCVYCEDPIREGDDFRTCGKCPPCKKYQKPAG